MQFPIALLALTAAVSANVVELPLNPQITPAPQLPRARAPIAAVAARALEPRQNHTEHYRDLPGGPADDQEGGGDGPSPHDARDMSDVLAEIGDALAGANSIISGAGTVLAGVGALTANAAGLIASLAQDVEVGMASVASAAGSASSSLMAELATAAPAASSGIVAELKALEASASHATASLGAQFASATANLGGTTTGTQGSGAGGSVRGATVQVAVVGMGVIMGGLAVLVNI